MLLELTTEQVTELADLLQETLRELSHEIADTENARYRTGLLERRRLLQEMTGLLSEDPGARGRGRSEGDVTDTADTPRLT